MAGGKVVLRCLAEDVFDYGAIVHPAMIAKEDGDNLKQPLGFYPSADEPKDVIEYIAGVNKTKFGEKGDFVHFSTV